MFALFFLFKLHISDEHNPSKLSLQSFQGLKHCCTSKIFFSCHVFFCIACITDRDYYYYVAACYITWKMFDYLFILHAACGMHCLLVILSSRLKLINLNPTSPFIIHKIIIIIIIIMCTITNSLSQFFAILLFKPMHAWAPGGSVHSTTCKI